MRESVKAEYSMGFENRGRNPESGEEKLQDDPTGSPRTSAGGS